jgi:hypothetical protein
MLKPIKDELKEIKLLLKQDNPDDKINSIKKKLEEEYNASEIFIEEEIIRVIKECNYDYKKIVKTLFE